MQQLTITVTVNGQPPRARGRAAPAAQRLPPPGSRPHRHPRRLRARRVRRLHRPLRRRAGALLHHVRRAGRRPRHPHRRGPRGRRGELNPLQAAFGSAHGAPVRLLHAGLPDDPDGVPARDTRRRPKPRSARRSPAISAAAPATSTSSTRCSSRAMPTTARYSLTARVLAQRGRAPADRAARSSSTMCSCRGCCTWRSCAATTRTGAITRVDVAPRAQRAGRRRRLHRRRSRRLRQPGPAARAAAADPGPRFQRAARRCRSPRTRCATSASRSRWSSPRAATWPKTRSRTSIVDIEPLDAVVDLEAALQPARRSSTSDLGVERRRARRPARATTRRRGSGRLVVRAAFLYDRGASAAIENRAVVAQWDARAEEMTIWDTTQAPIPIRNGLAAHARPARVAGARRSRRSSAAASVRRS